MRTEKQQSKGQIILSALKRAYPGGLTSIELMEITSRAQARIGELKQQGWSIETIQDGEDSTATYRLSSLIQQEGDDVVAGVTIRLGSRSGWTSRTHREAVGGSIPDHVLDEAERAALDAYRGVIEDWQKTQVRRPVQKSAIELFCEI